MGKPLSKTEIAILIYNRVKRGVPYDEAKKQVMAEIEEMDEVKQFEKAKKKAKKQWIKDF